MKRYMMLVNFDGGTVEAPMDEWKPEEVAAHMDYYRALNKELRETGELVEAEALAGPDLAKIVTSDGLTAPVVTDGPFQEIKEWVAGYMIVDVESEERAIEIAARYSAVPGPAALRSSSRSTCERCELAEACADEPVRRRGPAARARAAGPRRARAQVRRLRRRRGCRSGGAARGVRALAAGRHPGGRPRLADPGRRAAADRPVAERAVPRGSGGGRCAAGAAGPRGVGGGRHVDGAVHVLPSGADTGLGDRADAARGRRADDSRDRERVHGRRGDDGAAHLAGQAAHQGVRRCRSGCRPARSRRPAGGASSTSSTSSSTRGTRAARGARCSGPSCRTRRSG